jgi:hypothetical protein
MDSKAAFAAAGALLGGLVVAAIMGRQGPGSRIERLRTEDPRSSAIVKHNGVVMISGQVRAAQRCDTHTPRSRADTHAPHSARLLGV